MDGKRLIEKIRLRNILSFGDKGEEIELLPLNVIIGQNASGKSNLIDVIKLLRSLSLETEKELPNFISRNGGISEWIWKGKTNDRIADVYIFCGLTTGNFKYQIKFKEESQRLQILEINVDKDDGVTLAIPQVFLIFETYADLDTTRKSEIRKPQVPDAPNEFLEEDGSNLALVLNDLEHRGDTKDKIVENLKKFNP